MFLILCELIFRFGEKRYVINVLKQKDSRHKSVLPRARSYGFVDFPVIQLEYGKIRVKFTTKSLLGNSLEILLSVIRSLVVV